MRILVSPAFVCSAVVAQDAARCFTPSASVAVVREAEPEHPCPRGFARCPHVRFWKRLKPARCAAWPPTSSPRIVKPSSNTSGLADAASLIPTSDRCSASPQFLKAAPRVERLERSSQHPLPIRRFRRASGLRHSQIEAQVGVRVSERHHRLCAGNRCRRNVVRW
jgi:hypothetical protein